MDDGTHSLVWAAGNMTEEELKTGQRAAPRLALSIPGKFLGVRGNFSCILTDLSRTGVRIAIEEPLNLAEDGYLRAGPVNHFMTVARKGTGMNALAFDIPVDDVFVFGIRRYQEQLAEQEESELMELVRSWTSGKNTGHY